MLKWQSPDWIESCVLLACLSVFGLWLAGKF
jgi:hypothetical protein